VYSGTGVTGNSFSQTNPAIYSAAYSYTDTSTGCSNSALKTITVNVCAGVEELSQSKAISVYPNPGDRFVQVVMKDQNLSVIELSVMDYSGRKVMEQKFTFADKLSLDLSDLVSGIYFIELRSDNTISGRVKLIKQ
ncbi:MAG: T9SS type A sorting domain-containing protein, partial [Bacteroidia bacterium]